MSYGSAWKEGICRHFRDFCEFFFPAIAAEIYWTYAPQFRDKELRALVRAAKCGRREADLLVEVRRLDGRQSLVLVHIEVQNQVDEAFEQRMFIYHYRAFDPIGPSRCAAWPFSETQKSTGVRILFKRRYGAVESSWNFPSSSSSTCARGCGNWSRVAIPSPSSPSRTFTLKPAVLALTNVYKPSFCSANDSRGAVSLRRKSTNSYTSWTGSCTSPEEMQRDLIKKLRNWIRS